VLYAERIKSKKRRVFTLPRTVRRHLNPKVEIRTIRTLWRRAPLLSTPPRSPPTASPSGLTRDRGYALLGHHSLAVLVRLGGFDPNAHLLAKGGLKAVPPLPGTDRRIPNRNGKLINQRPRAECGLTAEPRRKAGRDATPCRIPVYDFKLG